jgi:hypothetical protein
MSNIPGKPIYYIPYIKKNIELARRNTEEGSLRFYK